jgi:hypothetical protein
MSDEFGSDGGVQHVADQNTRFGASGESSISGKASSSGFIDFSKAKSPRLQPSNPSQPIAVPMDDRLVERQLVFQRNADRLVAPVPN